MNRTIELVDAIMGSGKTTSIIAWMEKNPCERYIYVSPLLSEVDEGGRLHQSLSCLQFHSPTAYNTTSKSDSLFELLNMGVNISCTHALFSNMNDKHFDLIKKYNYIVVLDEEIQMIESFNLYSRSDLQWLQSMSIITISEDDGGVSWIDNEHSQVEDVHHKYWRLKQMCDGGALYCAKRSDTMLNVQLPTKLLECAKRTVLLTYMFEGNVLCSFLKLKGFDIVPFAEELNLQKVSGGNIRSLIKLYEPPKKFDLRNKLTYSWYANPNKGDLDKVKNAIRNMAIAWGANKDNLLYTLPKSRSVVGETRGVKIKPIGLTIRSDGNPCWLAASTKATNDYGNIKYMIHVYSRHPNVSVASYLQDYDCAVRSDAYALSELIQWLWRGCIRNGEVMHVSIFSSRMEKLFLNWLDSLPN